MKANEFIKKYGLEKVRSIINKYPNYTHSTDDARMFVNEHDCIEHIKKDLHTCVRFDDLKRLIESHYFAEQVEGLETVRTMIKTMDEHNLKKMPTSFNGDSLGCFTRDYFVQVVHDVESCQ